MRYYNSKRRDTPGDYFPLPKAIFRLGLGAGEIAVLAFLMYCEDRKTYKKTETNSAEGLLLIGGRAICPPLLFGTKCPKVAPSIDILVRLPQRSYNIGRRTTHQFL